MSSSEVGQLQATLLEAILEEKSLPGSKRQLSFPDLSFILGQPVPVIAKENLASPELLEESSFSLEILPLSKIRERADNDGDISYLRFKTVEQEGDTIRFSLHGEIAPQDPDQQLLGLSGVRVGFRRADSNDWELAEDPVFFAI